MPQKDFCINWYWNNFFFKFNIEIIYINKKKSDNTMHIGRKCVCMCVHTWILNSI